MAILDELESLDAKGTWIVDESLASQTSHRHVILNVKRKADSSVELPKARADACGNYQKFG